MRGNSMPICSNCGSNVDQSANNCPQCGSSLNQQCPICGNHIQSDQRFCSGCGLQVINNESIVYSCLATSITGLSTQEEGTLKLSNYRIVFVSQNIPGKEGILQIPITKIKHLSKKASIAYASKGTYQITIKASNPKGTFKFVANAGKNFVKHTKKVQRNPRIIPSPSTTSTAKPPKPTTDSSTGSPQPLSHQESSQANQTSSKMTWGLGILCFFIPLLGIFIWLTERDKNPKKAKAAIFLTIYPTFMLFLIMSQSGNHQTSNLSVSSEPIHAPAAPSSDFSMEVVYNDVYDVPIKTQVERHYVVSGEISYSELEDFLEDTYEELISSTGYEYRDHPDAVYLYVYTPGTSETNWIAMLDKSAGSSGPSISINISPGSNITVTDEYTDSIENIELEELSGDLTEINGANEIEISSTARFQKLGDVITDSQTGLQWRVGPDRDTNWFEARDWVNGLGGDWRMPMQNELLVLFDAGITYDDPGLFVNGGWSVWCGDTRSDNYSCDFDLGLGEVFWGPKEGSGYTRAFAVRSQ